MEEIIREITNENIDELIITEIREGIYAFLSYIKSPYNRHSSITNCAYEELLNCIDVKDLYSKHLTNEVIIPDGTDYIELLQILGIDTKDMVDYVIQGLSYEAVDFSDYVEDINNELTFSRSALNYIVCNLSRIPKSKIPSLYNMYSFVDILSIINSLKNSTLLLEELKDVASSREKPKELNVVQKVEDIKNYSEMICPFFTNKKTLCYTSQCMAWESTGQDSTRGFCKRLK